MAFRYASAIMELVYVAECSVNLEQNLRVLSGFVPRHTGQLPAELAFAGTPIGSYDQMIAGDARSLGLIVITNNVEEFKRVEEFRVDN